MIKVNLLIIILKQEEATEERCCCNHSSTISMLHKTVTVVLVKQHVVAVWKLDVRMDTALHHSPFKYEAPAHTRGNKAANIKQKKSTLTATIFTGEPLQAQGQDRKETGGKTPGALLPTFFAPKRLPHTKTPQGVHCSKHKLRRSEGTKLSP